MMTLGLGLIALGLGLGLLAKLSENARLRGERDEAVAAAAFWCRNPDEVGRSCGVCENCVWANEAREVFAQQQRARVVEVRRGVPAEESILKYLKHRRVTSKFYLEELLGVDEGGLNVALNQLRREGVIGMSEVEGQMQDQTIWLWNPEGRPEGNVDAAA